jgi:hypothetical protein
MIKDLGNCGCIEKAHRIHSAIKNAKENRCGLAIKLDPSVYGNPNHLFSPIEVENYDFSFDRDNLFIISEKDLFLKLPWWDIVKVAVLW